MSGMPYPAADHRGPLTPNASDTGIALTFFTVLALVTLTLAGVVRLAAPAGCSLDDSLVLLQASGEGSAVSRGGAHCLVAPPRSDWRVRSLELVTPPSNGTISMRGATGLYYYPNSQFKGRDSFAFRVVRRTDNSAPVITLITMRVDVD